MLLTEESYTSKVSFVDKDKLPDYRMKDIAFCIFSGRIIQRGLYRTGIGTVYQPACHGLS